VKTRCVSTILDEWPALQFGDYFLQEFAYAVGVKEKQQHSLYRRATKMIDAMKRLMKKVNV